MNSSSDDPNPLSLFSPRRPAGMFGNARPLIQDTGFARTVWRMPAFKRPNCGSKYVFLPLAVEEVGKALFQDQTNKWDGSEPDAIMNALVANLAIPTLANPKPELPPDLQAVERARQRAFTAMRWIRDEGREGNLDTYIFVTGRLAISADPLPQTPSFWGGEEWDWQKYFYTCKGQHGLPSGLIEGWTFLSRKSLDRALGGQGAESAPPPAAIPPAAMPVPEATFIRWFAARAKQFEGERPPRWQDCHKAAIAAFPSNRITKDALLAARRLGAPAWRQGRR